VRAGALAAPVGTKTEVASAAAAAIAITVRRFICSLPGR
jgi:hypothetical protein